MNTRLLIGFFISISFLYGKGQSCLPNGISYNEQASIDAFPANFPGCTSIEGNLFIGGFYEDPSNIQNVDSLIGLTSIGGDLIVSGYYGNDDFSSLAGFSNLISIGGDLILEFNYALTSLEGLNQLVHVGGNLVLNQQPVNSLSSLGSLVDIGGNLSVGATHLQDLTGLSSLASVDGDILIGSNSDLMGLTGLEWLTQSNGALAIENNSSLESLTGLENLISTNGYLNIRDNLALADLNGLANLVSVGGSLELWDNNSLDDFTGLNSLGSIGGSLTIYSNPGSSLSGLENLGSIGGNLFISWVGWLTNLDELENLTSIGGTLQIDYNGALLNLDGLRNIQANSISGLKIRNNLSLANCSAQSICNYLSAPSGTVEITNNSTGCNSPAEVLQSCELSVIETGSEYLDCHVYPNPSSGRIRFTFTLRELTSVHFSIKTLFGKPILERDVHLDPGKPFHYDWDATSMPAGIYFYKLTAGNSDHSGKIILIR